MDWLLKHLADAMGVAPPREGEGLVRQIEFEQPWNQAALLLVVLGAGALIVWFYRREGGPPLRFRMLLAALRIALVLLAVFMLSEAVLAIRRTGLPDFLILVDDSASSSVVDPYADPATRAKAEALATAAGRTQADRLAVAEGWLLRDDAKLLKTLAQGQRVRIYRVSKAAEPVADVARPEDVAPAIAKLRQLTPEGPESRLGDGLRAVLKDPRTAPPTAVLLLTDGQTTAGATLSEAAELARQKDVPLFAVGLGDTTPARDLELADLQLDDLAFVGDVVRVRARLRARGFGDPKDPSKPTGESVTVKLRRRKADATDPNAAEDLAETPPIPVPPDGQAQPIELAHVPKETGDVTYILEVKPVARELQGDNNRLAKVVSVRDEKIKVLLADGEPRYEYRYLKSFLERDKSIDLSVVLSSSDEEYSEQDRYAIPAIPAQTEGDRGLFAYDVVILGDIDPTLLGAGLREALHDFVAKKGGGLLFVAGEDFNPAGYRASARERGTGKTLEDLLPIDLDGARNPLAQGPGGEPVQPFRPRLTVEGRTSPIFRLGEDEKASREIWEILPELNWYFEAPKAKPGATILAEHPTKAAPGGKVPILLYHDVGAGKAMFHAVDDTWRWRFRVGDRYFGRFWLQEIRFLARSKKLGNRPAELTTDRLRYDRDQEVRIRVRFPNPGVAAGLREVAVEVRRDGQSPRRVTLRALPGSPGLYEGTFAAGGEGRYEAQLLPPPTLPGDKLPNLAFQVDPPAGEFNRVEMDVAELTRAAEPATSGAPTEARGKFVRWDQDKVTVETIEKKEIRSAAPTPGARVEGSGADRRYVTTVEVPRKEEKTLAELLPRPRRVPLDADPARPLWNTWPVLAAFLTILTVEWILRKRKQMV